MADKEIETPDEPWFTEVLKRYGTRGSDEKSGPGHHLVSRGEIDLPGGVLRIASPYGFSRGGGTDLTVWPGSWEVASIEANQTDEGSLGLALVRRADDAAGPWTATSTTAVDVAPGQILVGDAQLALGTGPLAEAYPMLGHAHEPLPASWVMPDAQRTGPLLPSSPTRSYVDFDESAPLARRAGRSTAPSKIWLCEQDSGEATCVVIDHLASLDYPAGAHDLDAWSEHVAGTGGRLTSPVSGEPERGDLGIVLVQDGDLSLGTIRRVGLIDLAGSIVGSDRRWVTEDLGVTVESGAYPVFLLENGGDDDLLVIRLGDDRPKRWFYHSASPNPEGGFYAVASADTWLTVTTDDRGRERVLATMLRGRGTSVLEIDDVGSVVINNGTGGMDASTLVGLDDAGTVQALAFALVGDFVWAGRPEEEDGPLLHRLQEKVEALPPDPSFVEYWEDLQDDIRRHGGINRSIRASMYEMAQYLDT